VSDEPEFVQALRPVVDAVEAVGGRSCVVGSVASSVLGLPRATVDVDVLAELALRDVPEFVRRLGGAYYADGAAIAEAVRRGTPFNVIHQDTLVKIDVYVAGARPWERERLARAVARPLSTVAGAREYRISSPEDVVVSKLEWFHRGGRTSERQWGDVLGVLRVQGDALDFAYMRRWASELGVSDLLEKALAEAGGTG
jgi:hypothetical protein